MSAESSEPGAEAAGRDAEGCVLLIASAPDGATAERLARTLIEARLAACVSHAGGFVSHYRWEGALERSDEVQLLIKTSAERAGEATKRLVAEHPYEVPEVIRIPITGGDPRYLAWVRQESSSE